jgi:hypothetical protein
MSGYGANRRHRSTRRPKPGGGGWGRTFGLEATVLPETCSLSKWVLRAGALPRRRLELELGPQPGRNLLFASLDVQVGTRRCPRGHGHQAP